MAPKNKGAGQDQGAGGPGPDLAALYRSVAKKSGADVVLGVDMAPTAWLSTGMPLVDLAFGGGIPRGRITHVWGDSVTGKSALGLWLIAQQQKAFPSSAICVLDTEKALALPFMESMGVNASKLAVFDPRTVEDTFKCAEEFVTQAVALGIPGEQILVIWDSLAATLPTNEADGDYDDPRRPGSLAASISLGLKKIRPIMVNSGAVFLVLNQCRSKIGVMFGAKTGPCGGLSPKFYADLSVRATGMATFKHGDNPYGLKIGLTVEKSRVGINAGRKARYHCYFIAGILTDLPEFYDALKLYGLARNSGAKIIVGEREFSNKADFLDVLGNDPPYRQTLVDAISAQMLVGTVVADSDAPALANDTADESGDE